VRLQIILFGACIVCGHSYGHCGKFTYGTLHLAGSTQKRAQPCPNTSDAFLVHSSGPSTTTAHASPTHHTLRLTRYCASAWIKMQPAARRASGLSPKLKMTMSATLRPLDQYPADPRPAYLQGHRNRWRRNKVASSQHMQLCRTGRHYHSSGSWTQQTPGQHSCTGTHVQKKVAPTKVASSQHMQRCSCSLSECHSWLPFSQFDADTDVYARPCCDTGFVNM
jgi:hypothetical protein